MFSYILVVFTGYIPLISIFPMLKTGKLYSRYLQTANLFKNYFKGAKM